MSSFDRKYVVIIAFDASSFQVKIRLQLSSFLSIRSMNPLPVRTVAKSKDSFY